jgi:two-component system response regulator YesN
MYRMLIAEDEDIEHAAIARAVRAGCPRIDAIFEASDGLEALSLYRGHRPDILLLDIRMPGLDGIELAREVKGGGGEEPIAFVTACADFNFAREALRLGVKDYLLKPIDDEALVALIERLCSLLDESRAAPRVRRAAPESGLSPRLQALMLEAEAFILSRYQEGIGLDDVARRVGLSPCYFSKVFGAWKGTSFVDHLNGVRLSTFIENSCCDRISSQYGLYGVGFTQRRYRRCMKLVLRSVSCMFRKPAQIVDERVEA